MGDSEHREEDPPSPEPGDGCSAWFAVSPAQPSGSFDRSAGSCLLSMVDPRQGGRSSQGQKSPDFPSSSDFPCEAVCHFIVLELPFPLLQNGKKCDLGLSEKSVELSRDPGSASEAILCPVNLSHYCPFSGSQGPHL